MLPYCSTTVATVHLQSILFFPNWSLVLIKLPPSIRSSPPSPCNHRSTLCLCKSASLDASCKYWCPFLSKTDGFCLMVQTPSCLLVRLSFREHSGFFCFVAIFSNAIMNLSFCSCFWIIWRFISVLICFFRNCQSVFHSSCFVFHPHKGSAAPCLPMLVAFIFHRAVLMGVEWWFVSLTAVSWYFSSPCLSWPLEYISWRNGYSSLCQFWELCCLLLAIGLEEFGMSSPY